MTDRIFGSSDEEVVHIADLLQKGASGARSDDTRSLKSAVLDWITPNGENLNPPLSRHIKSDRGFRHDRTGALLCPTGMDWTDPETRAKLVSCETLVRGDKWPILIYQGYEYDPEDPWRGAFRSAILVKAFKHIFTSPSSVEKENKATRSGNARIHGMLSVTRASVASASMFSRTDIVTDSDRFYNTVLKVLHDPEEVEDVNPLLQWWNRQVFPGHEEQAYRSANPKTALARIKARRAALRAAEITNS
ncbi:hypothetical protein DXG01_007774 [Tephrocybe rancida]|nr:hypothetical protein DXG01_007774 [Tephrocybe rancida]